MDTRARVSVRAILHLCVLVRSVDVRAFVRARVGVYASACVLTFAGRLPGQDGRLYRPADARCWRETAVYALRASHCGVKPCSGVACGAVLARGSGRSPAVRSCRSAEIPLRRVKKRNRDSTKR